MTFARLLAAGACALAAALAAPAAAAATPYSSHSQLYACCTDSATKEAMFREAKESGAAYIRLDFELETMFSRGGPTDWTGPDEVAELSRRFGLPVLATLLGTPRENTDCPSVPWPDRYMCPAADAAEWGEQAGRIADRYQGVIDHFQIGNEPDGGWAFLGQPEDYARMLSAAYDGIHAGSPAATVVLGPTMRFDTQGSDWLERVFRTPGADAADKFDVASMHMRSYTWRMVEAMGERQAFLRGWGRNVPMWITEHGYSADSGYQFDPAYRGGEPAQAAYLAQSLPALAKAGADQVFVTLRDGGDGQYAAEGILGGTDASAFRRKAAWWAVRQAVDSWGLPEPAPAVAAPLPAPVAQVATLALRFRSSFLSSRASVRRVRRTTHKVTVSGRFRGRGCSGKLALSYRLRGMKTVRRTVRVGRTCRFRQVVSLRAPARLRSRDRLKVAQRFAGNGATSAGSGRTLSLKLSRPRRRS